MSQIPGDLPAGWAIRPLEDCATRVRDAVSPSAMEDTRYIGLEHIGSGTLRLIGHGSSSEVSSTKFRFQTGDILFGKLRPYLHKVTRAPFDGICSTDIFVVRSRHPCEQAFLYHCMSSADFVRHASASSEGTKMPRARWSHLTTYPMRLPPLPEQRRISAALDAIDHTLHMATDAIDSTERLREALRHELLTAGMPATERERERERERE